MSFKRKGQLTKSPERHRHLGNFLKRFFWRRERLNEKNILKTNEMKMNKLFFSSLIVSIMLLISCNHKLVNYPIEPNIEFKNIEITKGLDVLGNQIDSIKLTLNYTDGDSNIGRYISCDTCYSDYNCIVTYYKKTNGIFNFIVGDNPGYYLIPEIPTPNKTYKRGNITVKTITPVEGELQIVLLFFKGYTPVSTGDTLKFTVQIVDNDNNKSNMAEMEKVHSYE